MNLAKITLIFLVISSWITPGPTLCVFSILHLLFLGQNSLDLVVSSVCILRWSPSSTCEISFSRMLFSCLGQIGFQTKSPGTPRRMEEIFFLLYITVSSSASRGLREHTLSSSESLFSNAAWQLACCVQTAAFILERRRVQIKPLASEAASLQRGLSLLPPLSPRDSLQGSTRY